MEDVFINYLLIVSGYLLIASVVYYYTRNFIIPWVTIMMIAGLIVIAAPQDLIQTQELYSFVEHSLPEIILLLFIPLLVFESARTLKLRDLRKEIIPIGFYSIAGVIITLFLIGIGISVIFGIPLIHALLFGAIVASTDPVAVSTIFKKFPIPYRLNTLIEWESLLNDATSLISFSVISGIIFSGLAFSFINTSASFVWSMVGSILLGSALGYVGGKVLNQWKGTEFVSFTLSIAMVIGGYVIADHFLHVSGVVTIVFLALVLIKTHKDLLSEMMQSFHLYWDYLAFTLNALLFYLMGVSMAIYYLHLTDVWSWILIILAPISIVMLARVVLVRGGDALLRIAHVRIPAKWQNVLIYGGLRGGICVALVLSLPNEYEYKALFVTLVFSLILVNLVVNPILLSRYLKKSKLDVDTNTDRVS
ncbi:MAG TPA: sodium:proton antiporter [Nitrososphaeraceae archaeon]|nr:sodium:proton antiporter [Nitrososphaeraceae archaeon]